MRSSYVKTNSSKSYTLFLVICFALLFYFWPSVRPVLYKVIEPISSSLITFANKNVFTNNLFVYFKNKSELEQGLAETKAELEEANNKNNMLRVEIDEILTKLSMTSSGRIDSVAALAVGNIDGQMYKTALLNKGFRDGVEVGAIVYTSNMNVVGRVSEVFNRTCKVDLSSKEGNEVSGILESTGEVLKLTGIGSGSYVGYISNFNNKSSKYDLLKSYYTKNIPSSGEGVGMATTTETGSETGASTSTDDIISVESANINTDELLSEITNMASSTRVMLTEDKGLVIGEIVDRTTIIDEDKIKIVVKGNYDPAHLEEFYISK